MRLRRFSEDDLASIRAIPGRRWDPERAEWEVPDTPATVTALSGAFGVRLVLAHGSPEPGGDRPSGSERDGTPRISPVRHVQHEPPGGPSAVTVPRDRAPAPRAHHRPDPAQDALLDEMRSFLRTGGYSAKTERAYLWWTRRFLAFRESQAPSQAGPYSASARAFLQELAAKDRLAAKTRNQAASALAFLMREILGDATELDIPHAKGPRRLPSVLSHREVLAVLGELQGKHALVVSLLYAGGLRIEECLKVRVKDLDFELRQVLLRDGKGQKDRYAPLAHRIVGPLRAQVSRVADLHARDRAAGHGWAALPSALHRKDPGAGYELGWQFVFPSRAINADPATERTGRWHMHPSAVQREVKAAARRSGIAKRVSCHTFRHSFATEALRGGCDIRTLQHVMGHRDVRTTMIYLHVVEQTGLHIRSPLDRPGDPDDLERGNPLALLGPVPKPVARPESDRP